MQPELVMASSAFSLEKTWAPAGRDCAKLESNRSNEDKEWINMGKYATRWKNVEKMVRNGK